MAKRTKGKQIPTGNGEYVLITDSDTDEDYFSKTDGQDSDGKTKPARISMYCKHTHYEVVKESGKAFLNFHLTKKERSDWDIAWFDGWVSI